MDAEPERVTFATVLRTGEFRALWLAELLSTLGDQVARVALAVLVFNTTDSAVLTGLTFALTYVPTLLGGLFLSGLGDRFPRREVMVAANVVQAVLVAAMAVPGVPLPVLCVLLAVSVLATGPFNAAQLAILPDLLSGQRYVTAMSLRNVTTYSAQLAGFAGGGLLIAVLNPYLGLAIDSLTFVLSAALLWTGIHRRPAVRSSGAETEPTSILHGFTVIWRDPRTRILLGIGALALFYIAPEALGAPYAKQLGMGPTAVGLLMAADPVGAVVGSLLFERLSEVARLRSVGWLGVAAGAPIAACALYPNLVLSMALFACSGAAATIYTIQAMTTASRLLPNSVRAQGMGFASAVIQSVQGVGALVACAFAQVFTPVAGMAIVGCVGVVLAAGLALAWRRVANPAQLAVQLTG
jgi:MFS family permease